MKYVPISLHPIYWSNSKDSPQRQEHLIMIYWMITMNGILSNITSPILPNAHWTICNSVRTGRSIDYHYHHHHSIASISTIPFIINTFLRLYGTTSLDLRVSFSFPSIANRLSWILCKLGRSREILDLFNTVFYLKATYQQMQFHEHE